MIVICYTIVKTGKLRLYNPCIFAESGSRNRLGGIVIDLCHYRNYINTELFLFEFIIKIVFWFCANTNVAIRYA